MHIYTYYNYDNDDHCFVYQRLYQALPQALPREPAAKAKES